MRCLCVILFSLAVIYGQGLNNGSLPTSLHNGLSEKIGNFSIELLYHTAKTEVKNQNFIMSPITVWTVLAVISEGASGDTLAQINNALRIKTKNRDQTRKNFREIAQWLTVHTPNIELSRINAMFVDQKKLINADYRAITKGYETEIISLDFTDAEATANIINTGIANFSHGRISHLVESSYFGDTEMIITSGLYFKGQWSIPFNATSTVKLPFYSSEGQKTGEVNMMYNRYTYPFANIRELQARVIELPYGTENRLSMLIMLPNPKVSLEKMFFNFANVTLDTLFEELRVAKEDYGEDEVDCFIPRFKIESNLDLTEVLKNAIGIQDLFDQARARLPHMARTPMYVTKVIHKAEIEVTEEGTTASAITAAEFSNRIGVVRFEANRPFTYLIIEKVTNSIVFAGFYQQPSLY